MSNREESDYQHYTPRSNGAFGFWVALGIIAFVVVFSFVVSGFNKVEAGHVTVITKSGKVEECRKPSGYTWDMPIITKTHTYDTRRKSYELVDTDPSDSDSKAEYVDWNIDSNSKNGVPLSAKLVVQYHINPDQVCTIFATLKNNERVQENVVKQYVRAVVPQVLNTYETDFLYFGNLAEVSETIKARLNPLFEANGVEMDYFELKRPTFDAAYTANIQGRAAELSTQELIKAQQETQKQQNEKDKLAAEGQANVAKINAQRDQDAATINSKGAAERVAIDAKAAADKVAIDAKAEADRLTTIAKANASATTLQAEADNARLAGQVEAVGGPEANVQLETARAIGQAKAIYLPSDSIPLLNMILGDPATAQP
jgi:regulator of protease activity HflC (stomatin/prohibitin superfamily)